MTKKEIAEEIEKAKIARRIGIEKAEKLSAQEKQQIACEFILQNKCKTARRKHAINKK